MILVKKNNSLDNLQCPITTLKEKHTITVEMTGSLCISVTLDWNHNKREVTFSMPDFYPLLLRKVNHELSSKPQCSPFLVPHATCDKHVTLSPDLDA